MISLKSEEEIRILRRCNKIVAETRYLMKQMIQPGISTIELDHEAEALILKRGAKPAFKGYRGYPNTICTSLNDEVVHGIPGKRVLKEGDVIAIDMGAVLEGYYGDTAITCPVGVVSQSAKKLLQVTEEALYKGIEAAKPGGHLHDIGAAVQDHVENAGFSVVREFVGHGIGQALHEDPQIPNFGKRGTGVALRPGMVLAIEPMVNEGTYEVKILSNGWTAVTTDGKLSAHFEHSIVITEEGPFILSDYDGEQK